LGKKQNTIALSTAEAQYLTINIFIKRLVEDKFNPLKPLFGITLAEE